MGNKVPVHRSKLNKSMKKIKKHARSLTEDKGPNHRFLSKDEKKQVKYHQDIKEKLSTILSLKKQVKVSKT